MIPMLRKLLTALPGVSIVKPRRRKTGIEQALEDVKAGRVKKADSVDKMFLDILGI